MQCKQISEWCKQSILPSSSHPRLLDSTFRLFQSHANNPAYSSLALLPPAASQHSLTAEIHSHYSSDFLSSSVRNRARLHSLALPHAGDWLNALPCSISTWTAALGYRLARYSPHASWRLSRWGVLIYKSVSDLSVTIV